MEVQRFVDPAFDVNVYLLGAKAGVLVDTGTGRRSEPLLRQVREALGGGTLSRVILTHRHVDHVGGARDMAAAWAVTPEASEDDAPPLREGDLRTTGAAQFGVDLRPLPVEDLPYGSRVDVGTLSLEVLHTPGHTAGSICLLADDGSLFSGDTVFAYGGVGRWDLPTGNRSELEASLRRLAGRSVERLYPGHGPSVREDAEAHLGLAQETLETSYG